MTRVCAVGVMLVGLAACGGGSESGGAASTSQPGAGAPAAQATGGATAPAGSPAAGIAEMAKGMEQVAQGFQQMAQNTAKPVDFEQLVTVLNEVDGWERSEPRGEQMNMPISFSKADARYRKGESQVAVEIQDSALSQLLMAPFSMFLRSGFEERSSDGYKRYVELGGRPGFEEWNSSQNNGEITIIVDKRFIVTARGTDVANLDPVKAILGSIGLNKLSGLAAAAK